VPFWLTLPASFYPKWFVLACLIFLSSTMWSFPGRWLYNNL
jgi:hypothetical protein